MVCYIYIFQERPQLEAQRSELLESITSDLQFLRDLEDKSLGLLQKSEGKHYKLTSDDISSVRNRGQFLYRNCPFYFAISLTALCIKEALSFISTLKSLT